MTTALLFVSTLVALLLLCVGQGRHGKFRAFHFLQPRAAKFLGTMILIASALTSIGFYGFAYGIVTWLGLAMTAAVGLVLFLTWRDDRGKS
ncbi:MAG: hypothetical protein JWO15_657 [Sphingomonadales bacterium]|nr:hypothetical protein [Sphingomonadales bacterium]